MGRAALYSDNNFGGEVVGFKVLSVKYEPTSRIIAAPVESGTMSFDNKVIDPPRVIVTGVVQTGDGEVSAYSAIKQMMANRDFSFYSVSDGKEYWNDLIMESAPVDRNSDKYDFKAYELVFKQMLLVQKQSSGKAFEQGYTSGTPAQSNNLMSGSLIFLR